MHSKKKKKKRAPSPDFVGGSLVWVIWSVVHDVLVDILGP